MTIYGMDDTVPLPDDPIAAVAPCSCTVTRTGQLIGICKLHYEWVRDVVAVERDECARMVERFDNGGIERQTARVLKEAVKEIRARGKQK